VSRRELIRRFLERAPPEIQLEEKIRSQTYTVTTISRKTINTLEDTCRKHNGIPTTTLPKTYREETPARPQSEIEPAIRKEISKKDRTKRTTTRNHRKHRRLRQPKQNQKARTM